MRKAFSFLLVLVLILSMGTVSATAASEHSEWDSQYGSKYPSDIVGTNYYTAVKALVDAGAVTGDTDGRYHPDKNITRAEFSKIVTVYGRAVDNYSTALNKAYFNDLSGYGWAKGYINCGYEEGLFNGTGGGAFTPGSNVTYQEVLTAMIRAKGDSVKSQAEALGSWPKNYIRYFETYQNANGVVINDYSAPATKGDVALLLYRNMAKHSATTPTLNVSGPANVSAGAVIYTYRATCESSGTLVYSWSVKNGGGTDVTCTPGAASVDVAFPTADNYYVTCTVTRTTVGQSSSTKTQTLTVTAQ